MTSTMNVQNVTGIDVGEITRYPAEETTSGQEFFTRVITGTDAKGNRATMTLFAHTEAALLTPDELARCKTACNAVQRCGLCAYCKAKSREAEAVDRIADAGSCEF